MLDLCSVVLCNTTGILPMDLKPQNEYINENICGNVIARALHVSKINDIYTS